MRKGIIELMKNVCVLGMGYTGLPTALMLAAYGSEVVGVDINQALIEQLQEGKLTFCEEGLAELFDQALSNSIHFQSNCPEAQIYIVAVPTPFNIDTKRIDPSFLVTAINNILDVYPEGSIIIIESTVSPGTIDRHIRPAIEERGLITGKHVHLSHAPERIIPGSTIRELRENARVIGADTQEVAEVVKELYASFCSGDIVVTDIRTAEMAKIVENTYRDINIAFANELAKICRHDDLDVYKIIKIANMHPRVDILQPGPGVGGHCISVDPWFLVGDHPRLSLLIHEARKINDSMPEFVLERVYDISRENGDLDISRIGFYGLTYKENVDDIRESPSLQIVGSMKKHLCGQHVKIYDPFIKADIVQNQYHDLDTFLADVDMVVILVAHNEIKENMGKLKDKIILDTRNCCDIDGVYTL